MNYLITWCDGFVGKHWSNEPPYKMFINLKFGGCYPVVIERLDDNI